MKHKRIRGLLGRVGIATAAALVAASAAALAAPAMALANSGTVMYETSDDTIIEDFDDLGELFKYVNSIKSDAVTIDLNDDWDTFSYGRIDVPEGKHYRFNLNGHMINRGKAGSYDSPWWGEYGGEVFHLCKGSELFLNGGDSKTEHWGTLSDNGRFWKANGNGVVGGEVIYGGLITGGATDGKDLAKKVDCAGGAISSDSSDVKLLMNNVTLAGNVSDTFGLGRSGKGGAICMTGEKARLSIASSKIMYNHAAKAGGAIYIGGDESVVSLSGTKVEHNYSGLNGGAINLEKGNELSILNGSTVSNNYADGHGGGIASFATSAKILVSQSTIKGNTCDSWGGGICYWSTGGLTVSQSTISNNVANDDGGAICATSNSGPLTIEKGSVIRNNSSGDEGGGIYYSTSNKTVSIDNSTISQNTAKTDGGGFYHNGRNGTLSITNGSKIDSNVASTGDGGGIYNNWAGTYFVISGESSISNNRAQGNGGGIYNYNNAIYAFSDEGRVYKNSAGSSGGGFYNDAKDTRIKFASGANFMNNTAVDGGGIYSCKSLTIVGDGKGVGGIKSNTATNGAGIVTTNDLEMRDISIMGNVSSIMAGGIFCKDTDTSDTISVGGTVVIDKNYNCNDDSNLEMPKAGPYLSFCSNLTTDSRIGVKLIDYGGSTGYFVKDTAVFNMLGDDWSKVFSSDLKKYSISKQSTGLMICHTPSAFEFVIYGSSGDALPSSWEQEGARITLDSSSFVKPGYVLDYWEIKGINGLDKLVPEDGKAVIIMPAGKVTARAHYKEVLSSIELGVEDKASWSELGKDASTAGVSAFRLSAGQSTSYGVYANDEIRKQVKVTDVSVKDNGDSKEVTYTVSMSAKVLESYGLLYDKDQMKSVYLESYASFDSAYDAKCKASVDADGNAIFTATVTFKEPAEVVTVSAVSANQAATGSAAFNIVVRRVTEYTDDEDEADKTDKGSEVSALAAGADGDVKVAGRIVTITAPDEPGWRFTKWKSVPDGAIVDDAAGTVTMAADEAAGAKLEAEYEPVVSAIAITVKKPVTGEAFSNKIESIKVAGGAELDLTDQLKDSIKVKWTLADGNPAGDVAESDTMYKATINTNASSLSYIFGMDSSYYATVNGEEPYSVEFDAGSKTGSIKYYATTFGDDSFDSVVEYPMSMVYTPSDLSDDLPNQVRYRLKNGTVKTASVTWDTSGVDTKQESGTFTVPGTFTDEKGDEHEASVTFVIIELAAPEASYAEKSDGSGTQLVTFNKGVGWQGEVPYTISYRVCTAEELESGTTLDESDLTKYTPGDQIELGEGEFIVAHAVVEVADGVWRDTGYEWYGRSLEFADIQIADGSTAGEYGAEPAVTVTLGGKTLTEFEDYTIDYYDNDEAGEGWVYIEALSDLYSGEAVESFKIYPAKVTGVKAKASGKKKVKLSWSKHKENVDGFEVLYATSKAKLAKGKGKTVKVKGPAKTSRVIKSLKSGKKYFFKVRAYKVVDGDTYYSAWSKVKAAKAK